MAGDTLGVQFSLLNVFYIAGVVCLRRSSFLKLSYMALNSHTYVALALSLRRNCDGADYALCCGPPCAKQMFV